jgi:hypothetical protein
MCDKEEDPNIMTQGSVNTFRRQRTHAPIQELLHACICGSDFICIYVYWVKKSVETFPPQRRIVGGFVFSAVYIVPKESRGLVLPRTSCQTTFLKFFPHVFVIHNQQ